MNRKTIPMAPRGPAGWLAGLAGTLCGVLVVAVAWLMFAPRPPQGQHFPASEAALPEIPALAGEAPAAAPREEAAESPAEPTPGPAPVAPAWHRFAAAWSVPDGWAKVVVLIDDVGPDRLGAARALALPPPLTLSILPYAERAAADAAAARARGHEVMLHLPMEPVDAHENPGPQALLVSLSRDEMRRRIAWNLDRFDGYVAVNNHMGSRATADAALMQSVMAALSERGLAWVDSRTSPRTVGALAAHAAGLPALSRDVFLDNDQSRDAVDAQLALLARLAQQRGHAIGIGHPHAVTLAALGDWLPTLAARRVALVPVSALLPAPDRHAALLTGR
jgi:polysaccharide deacetylase 2 family uncharacterized protein YibQ